MTTPSDKYSEREGEVEGEVQERETERGERLIYYLEFLDLFAVDTVY